MSKTILVVDDDEQIRNLIITILSNATYKVFASESGKEALKILEQHEIDLIITDIIMPDMEGVEFIKIVKREKKLPVKIIAMSGSGAGGTYLNIALKMGADTVLNKPFSLKGLLEAVRQIMS